MKPLAVYVHIPFCTIKCGYCDFNAYAGMDALKPAHRDALLAEIDGYADRLGASEVTSIGFGGGTPGEVPPSHIADVISAVIRHATLAPGAEVTLEANPGTSNLAYFAALRDAGVTRISLGAQSFDAAHLQFLDRIHSVDAIGASLRAARAAGIENVNLDLIYGLPGQSTDHWRDQLRHALSLGPDHLSCYALTVEEGTPLHARVERGDVTLPTDDELADMYQAAEAFLAEAGFQHYEISNWTRPGFESRHNMAYWTDRDYLGIGAGAHGFLDGQRYENVAHPRAYIESATTQASPHPVAATYELPLHTTIADWVTLRLRLVEGFRAGEFQDRFGRSLDDLLGPVLRTATEAGWLERDGNRVRLTPEGRLLHGELAVRIIDHLERTLPVSATAAQP